MLRQIKLNKILIFIIILLAALGGIVYLIKSTVPMELEKTVYVFSKSLERNTKITDEYISEKKFRLLNVPSGAITDKSMVINNYTSRSVEKGEVISKNSYAEEKKESTYMAKQGHVLVTIKFDSPDRANGFNVDKNQKIRLIYSPSSGLAETVPEHFKITKVIDAEIIEIQDINLFTEGELDYMDAKAMYITFEVTETDAIFIVEVKDKGRIEIIS
ncbi:SAF domain-containing protein (plasmid) [Vallitalea pronyensis]|uniref:SAF domain-containing protein n=1 Tax=Vallitalea pronyensis TaxID=1348613 RepID=A0A8J8SJS3_9FIRM|nr:SAF domain-containing protein [Vallitalea pronyensis]QUI25916.1 SAF domain-containing protein [Vallitalea pronyensis]